MIWQMLPTIREIAFLLVGVVIGPFLIAVFRFFDVVPEVQFGSLLGACAAFFAASVAFASIRGNQLSKLADDKITWGNKLRDELAELFGNLFISEKNSDGSVRDEYKRKSNVNHSRIKLLLDIPGCYNEYKKEGVPSHHYLNVLIEYRMSLYNGKPYPYEEDNNQKNLDIASRRVLDEIWNSAKELRRSLSLK